MADLFMEGYDREKVMRLFYLDGYREGYKLGYKEGWKIGYQEGLEEARRERLVRELVSLVRDGISDAAAAADYLGITEDKFYGLMETESSVNR